ncbi:MAG: CBS domain-containing protein [Erysipelotrichaceae bacterium]|nr:CBS domain-containing protein [Erysipelotrichaceae bacterium]MBQ1625542.1 CBS domain-containing protein [Erysipelotrichaceae bacterium]MBQ1774743.1 CBS domain-containing protein [Erysipelotrichaceae bacterium]MBQ2233230.1 CBS domain-containing protein [Erysipelotrichaceae bacterium]MBQ5553724.1 CBS domain-containing protein [Erysipelotrichaceae bacterium]
MYVKDNMVSGPITIGPDQSVSEAIDLMSENGLHRLPVVDKNGKLAGLITEGVITSNTPNNATSLSVFELNYLLNKLTIKDIMIKDVITIGKDALLEEAATILRKNDIGCLPVVDEDNTLIGIITHNDIFTAFIDLLGYNHVGTRYVISVEEDRTGILEDICRVFKEQDVSIANMAVYNSSRGIEIVVIVHGFDDITDKLEKAGYKVTSVMKLNEK